MFYLNYLAWGCFLLERPLLPEVLKSTIRDGWGKFCSIVPGIECPLAGVTSSSPGPIISLSVITICSPKPSLLLATAAAAATLKSDSCRKRF